MLKHDRGVEILPVVDYSAGRSAHIFNDGVTLLRVAQVIIEVVPHIGIARSYDRLSIKFTPRSADAECNY